VILAKDGLRAVNLAHPEVAEELIGYPQHGDGHRILIFAVQDRRAMAPFPQRTRAAVAAIDMANIAPAGPSV
jgi:hypothetical protein